MNITIPILFEDGPTQTIYAAEVNANLAEIANKFNTYAVQTDVAKTITAIHTFDEGIIAGPGPTGVALTATGLVDATASIQVQAAGYLSWNGRAGIKSPSDGVLTLLNNAETGFDRVQYGGVSNAFPAQKRSGADLQTRLADDSAYANLDALAFKVSGTQVVGARRAGWTDQTATAARTNLGVSPTVGALASFCRALYDDLKAHGLIGN